MPRILVALDPSIRCSGIAVFSGTELVAVEEVKIQLRGEHFKRAVAMGRAINAVLGPVLESADDVIVEWPTVRRESTRARRHARQDDLLPLTAVCGIVGAYAKHARLLIQVKPEEWKGQTSKPKRKADPYIVEAMVRERLSPTELAVLPPSLGWDGIDAIGVGLYALGRFEKRRAHRGAV